MIIKFFNVLKPNGSIFKFKLLILFWCSHLVKAVSLARLKKRFMKMFHNFQDTLG